MKYHQLELSMLKEHVFSDGKDSILEFYQCKRAGVKTIKDICEAIGEDYVSIDKWRESKDGRKIVHYNGLSEEYLRDEDVDV